MTALMCDSWTPEMVETMFMLGAYRQPALGKTWDAWAYMDWAFSGPGWSINIDMRLNPKKSEWDCYVQAINTEPMVRTFDRMTRAEAFAKVAELANTLTRDTADASEQTRALVR